MTRCDRFEREALLLLEEGKALDDAHFQTCPDCQRSRALYDRIRGELKRPPESALPLGFEQGVFAGIDKARPGVPRWQRRAPWITGGLLAAAALAGISFARLRPLDEQVALEGEVQKGEGATLRGEGAHPGDKLLLHGKAGSRKNAELRVYRNDRDLVMRCQPPAAADGFSCKREGAALSGELRLPAIGAFQALIASSNAPLPEPAGTLAEDTERLLAAGASVVLAPSVRVY